MYFFCYFPASNAGLSNHTSKAHGGLAGGILKSTITCSTYLSYALYTNAYKRLCRTP